MSLRTALTFVCFGFDMADFSVGLLFFELLAVIGCFATRDEADWLFALRFSPPLWFMRFSFFFCLALDGSWSGSRSDKDPVSGERSSRISLTSESSSRSLSEDS